MRDIGGRVLSLEDLPIFHGIVSHFLHRLLCIASVVRLHSSLVCLVAEKIIGSAKSVETVEPLSKFEVSS